MKRWPERITLFIWFAFIAYLLAKTGIVSDDFIYVAQAKSETLSQALIPTGGWLLSPIENYTHHIWYRLASLNNALIIDLLKLIFMIVSFYMSYKFFTIYTEKNSSLLISFLFIFFPSHDSTAYWFLETPLTLSIALYLYAFYMAHKERDLLAVLLATTASFLSYGSPPIAISMSILFLLHRNIKKALIMLLPNLAYVLYYLIVTKLTGVISRISESTSLISFMKLLFFQCATFLDSVIGPSMWLKIFYTIMQLSTVSLVIGIVSIAAIYIINNKKRNSRYDVRLLIALAMLAVMSFGLFAVTGRYPQLAFNLGNRTTVFGSLLCAYIIVLMPGNKIVRIAVISIMLLSILGISDHWKEWNIHQQQVINGIASDEGLKAYKDKRIIYVAGNQYSRLGRISHIEFFSEESATGPIFTMATGNPITAIPINRRCRYEEGYLVDNKYQIRDKVDGYINIYDSENKRLIKVNASDINKYIDTIPVNYRHWVQLLDIAPIKKYVVRIMPNLKYAT